MTPMTLTTVVLTIHRQGTRTIAMELIDLPPVSKILDTELQISTEVFQTQVTDPLHPLSLCRIPMPAPVTSPIIP